MAQPAKTEEPATFVDYQGITRVRGAEYVLPICVGTVGFWLGKKASEEKSHRWTVYVRGPRGMDISHAVHSVTFRLHPSFTDPERVLTSAPFELTEMGWGEFDIVVVVRFSLDSHGGEIEMTRRLKLYSEENSTQSTKKPVIREQYEEIVFSEPPVDFYKRVTSMKVGSAPESEITPHLPQYDEQHDLEKIRAARMRVASSLKKKLEGKAAGR
ncbi:unnamed protein product [Ostreobium quekettii]|uniref:YEATS domain-containing protein n=1 Tax=Ostreobium quekettii TaxID=121088 RepID=A0A8S1JIS6_9CHLO|nr:unnamed protein product [Ostreobium quekettii]|eukprot:evm.model.scf_373.7 EVM.evm.TU.scf_373.7   scf_373:53951-56264(+)